MNEKMTAQEAIHIMDEEGVRCRRPAQDLADDPLDQDGRALEHARRYRKKAEAAEKLVKIAQLWVRTTDE